MFNEVQEHPAPTDRELLRQMHFNDFQAKSENSLSVRACIIRKGKCTFSEVQEPNALADLYDLQRRIHHFIDFQVTPMNSMSLETIPITF